MTRVWDTAAATAAAAATPGWLTIPEAALLHELSRSAAERRVVELGAYQGRSTVALASGRASLGLTPVLTVDTFGGSVENQPGGRHHDPLLVDASGAVNTLPAFRASVERHQLEAWVEAWQMTTTEGASKFRGEVGLLFVDADHSYAGVTADINHWLPHLRLDSVIVLHDVGDWPGPTRAAADLLERGFSRLAQHDTALALRCPADGRDARRSPRHG